jgi:hypothetical protein
MKNEQLPALDAPVKGEAAAGAVQQDAGADRRLAERLGGPIVAYWNGARGSVCRSDVVALYHVLQQARRAGDDLPVPEVGRRQRPGQPAAG